MEFCRSGAARRIYRAVGGSTVVRIGGDLYARDGQDVDRPGELTPA